LWPDRACNRAGTLHLALSANFDPNPEAGYNQKRDFRSWFKDRLRSRTVNHEAENPCRSHKPNNRRDQKQTRKKSSRRKNRKQREHGYGKENCADGTGIVSRSCNKI